jgi:hypothetical protein
MDWHAAFRDGIRLALYPCRDSLGFEFGRPLNTGPLRAAAVIVKKEAGTAIGNPIGAIFREVNIAGYKSPADYLSENDFDKAGACARLYKALYRKKLAAGSISFVTTGHPRSLLKHPREELRFAARELRPGIYIHVMRNAP